MKSIDELRHEIDEIDGTIVAAFCRRMELAAEIGRLKSAQGLPIKDEARENELKQRVFKLSSPETGDQTVELYDKILSLSRDYQKRSNAK